MGKHYRNYTPNQSLLLPPSLQDWLPARHLAYFISETVDQLNLRNFEERYELSGEGTLPYAPALMVKILLYGYATGIFSSRKIANKLHEDIAFRVLGANNFPSYRTIARFRQENIDGLSALFSQVVAIAQEAGLVYLGLVAVDGSKVKANASKHKAMSYERMTTEEARLKKEVEELLKRAESIDAEEDAQYGADKSGDEIPAELERRESRRAVIKAAKERLEKRHKEAQEKQDDSTKDDPEPPAKMQDNFTDPGSRIMKSGKGFDQCYNTQISVEASSQLIIAAEVTQDTNDKKQLVPMVAAVERECGELPGEVLADSGYRSEKALLELEKQQVTGYVALGREQKDVPNINEDLHATKRVAHRLAGKRGSKKYRKRKSIVEPVFGWVKNVLGFRSFMLRGFENVGGEWRLLCSALNLRRMNTMMSWG
jgi:transposase